MKDGWPKGVPRNVVPWVYILLGSRREMPSRLSWLVGTFEGWRVTRVPDLSQLVHRPCGVPKWSNSW